MFRTGLLLLTLAVSTAWAQEPGAGTDMASADSTSQTSRQTFKLSLFDSPTPQFMQSQAFRFNLPSPSVAQRAYWYWEVDDTRRLPFPAYQYIPGQMAISDDISPVSLHWTFTGKRPLLPSFEIAGYQLRPGEGVGIYQKYDGRFSQDPAANGRLWLKTKHMIKESLKY
ncbi:MAG TPA: hypothetical protein VK473_06325 [Terriglobales bacterium]|nr:hypothetical protein [Terriglobales bacterium]